MTAPLSAGTRVTLTGTALGELSANGRYEKIKIEGDDDRDGCWLFKRSALQVVIPPEPQWTVGDAIRIDGETIARRDFSARGGVGWCGNNRKITDPFVSRAWSEGRVRVLYCQNQERDDD